MIKHRMRIRLSSQRCRFSDFHIARAGIEGWLDENASIIFDEALYRAKHTLYWPSTIHSVFIESYTGADVHIWWLGLRRLLQSLLDSMRPVTGPSTAIIHVEWVCKKLQFGQENLWETYRRLPSKPYIEKPLSRLTWCFYFSLLCVNLTDLVLFM